MQLEAMGEDCLTKGPCCSGGIPAVLIASISLPVRYLSMHTCIADLMLLQICHINLSSN